VDRASKTGTSSKRGGSVPSSKRGGMRSSHSSRQLSAFDPQGGMRYSQSSAQLSALEQQTQPLIRSRRRVRDGSF
jgi:hypothetical protein